MRVEEARMRLSLVMTEEELSRLNSLDYGEIGESLGLKTEIEADVHGMTKHEATRYIKNLIRTIRDSFWLVVIHGSNHGHAIKDAIREDGFDERAGTPYGVHGNEGRTLFDVADALAA